VLDRLPERRGDPAHAVEEDGIVPLEELPLCVHLQWVPGGVEASSIALLRDPGQRAADLFVGSPEHEVADLHRVVGSAGDDAVLLDDAVRRGETTASDAEEERDQHEKRDRARDAIQHEKDLLALDFMTYGQYSNQWS